MNRAILTAAFAGSAAALSPSAFAQTADWTGFYVGGTAGYSQVSDDEGTTVVFDTDRDGVFDDTVFTPLAADAFSSGFCGGAAQGRTPGEECRIPDDNNVNFAFRGGYDWQFGQWVVGALGEYNVVRVGDDVTAFSTTPASYTFTRDLKGVAAIRARIGYAWDASLLYATGGMAWGEIDHSFTTTNTVNSFDPSGGEDVPGYQLGAGYEVQLDPGWMGGGWSLGVEYLFTSLEEDERYQVAVGPGSAATNNPFLLVDPTGTDMRRSDDSFEFSSVGLTLTWRP
jgi:outer membrane immunogenic protein